MIQPSHPLKGHLIDPETRQYIAFQYNPNQISDEKAVNYAAMPILGQNLPQYQFTGGQNRRIRFTLRFFKANLRADITWLQAHQNRAPSQAAPNPLLLVWGDLYPDLHCILRDLKVQYSDHFAPANLEPLYAQAEITLEVLPPIEGI